ncbi:MAG: MerR family transcriptional regulator [Clostridiales bacterium]|jgi:DNA-binding transcriptional MerR regulator|nr:MerR family transcriptional regulator [Clostridiales bacterium]
MRIGEFAEKFGVKPFTVRHYIDKGLLLAERTGSQYIFSENDVLDMNLVLKLRAMAFSIGEIQEILSYRRVASPATDASRQQLIHRLIHQLACNKQEICRYQDANNEIIKLLAELKKELRESQTDANMRRGLSNRIIDLLCCPDCGCTPSVSDASFVNADLLSATITCACGYHARIENGIYIDESTMRRKTVFGIPLTSTDAYLSTVSQEFVNFKYKGMHVLSKQLAAYLRGNEVILEMDFCSGFFLGQFLEYVPPSATYILMDYDLDRLKGQKTIHDKSSKCGHIYLCCKYNRLPIKNESLDVIIDRDYTKDCARDNGTFMLDDALPRLKRGGILAGTYPFVNASADDDSLLGSAMNKAFVQLEFQRRGLFCMYSKEIGPVTEDGSPYHQDILNKKLYQMIYIGKKA